MTDGAAAVLLARRSFAEKNGLPILARFTDYQVAGCPPDIMGIGPAVVIPVLLERNKLNVGDIDIYEINEAFASQATYCVDKLKIDGAKLNPKGGAIALGHPLGCTGNFIIYCRLKTNRHSASRDEENRSKERSRFDVHWNRNGCCCLDRKGVKMMLIVNLCIHYL